MITRKKAITPIISVILLISIAVILTTIILTWGTDFTTKGTDKSEIIFEETNDYIIGSTKIQNTNLSFKNISPKKTVTITGYKILSNSEDSNFNIDVILENPITLTPGATGILSLNKLPPENKIAIELLTLDNKKITLTNILNNNSNITEDGGQDTNTEEPPIISSSEKEIIYFTINDTNGTIDINNNTITFSFAYGTTITNLTPTIVISEDATISPESGVAQDFTNPVNYTVTAEDESTKIYTIIVNVSEVPDGIGLIPTNGEIWYLEHLDYIDTNSTTLAGAYTLMRDLNFSDDSSYYDTANKITWTTGNGWTPLGNSSTKFTGTFNGNSKKISNLYINRSTTDYVGLFGYTNGSAVNISSLGLTNANIIGQNYVGIFSGYISYGTYNTNYATGNITGNNYVGGLVGYMTYATVSNSKSDITITANDYVGGLIGEIKGTTTAGTINSSYSNGTITGNLNVGGLIGIMEDSTAVNNSYSTAMVIGNYRIGGLVGCLSAYSSMSYKTTITNSYSSGYVRGSYPADVGGLVGLKGSYYTLTGNFWDVNTSGQTTSATGTGKTTAEMKSQSTYTTLNFTTTWNITEGESYPYLRTNTQSPTPTPIDPPAPIMIYTAEDLYNMKNDISRTAYYKLANDIDLNVSPYNTGEGWTPIGTSSSNAFAGILYGNGYKIRNLYINKPTTDYVGLFGYTNRYARFEDLIIEDANIRGQNYVGIITGYQNYGLVTRSYTTGNISGTNYIGGITGLSSYAEISLSHSSTTITATDYVGGISGYTSTGSITTSYSDSNISGDDYVGGLVGAATGTHNVTAKISYCYSKGNISGTGSYVGGLAGHITTGFRIEDSYSTSSVIGLGRTGGLVGYMYSDVSSLYTTVNRSYSSGYVYGSYNNNVGGLIGYSSGYTTISNSFWDINTSGQTTSSAGTGKTTTEMKQQATFTTYNFTSPWAITEGSSYPYLINNTQSPAPTSVAPPTPTMIYTAEDLYNIRNDISRTAYYKLANDIDLDISPYNTGSGWTPIGTLASPFNGRLEGNGYKIYNLYINNSATDYVGLFGATDRYAQLSDIILEDINIIGKNYTGGITGNQNYGLITRSNTTGYITGYDYVGGIAGKSNYATISYSNSNLIISAHDYVGGFVGYMGSGLITTSYSDSNISGNQKIGGIIGSASGSYNTTAKISYCYSKGNVSGTSSYIGGIAGHITTGFRIEDSYSTNSIIGLSRVGGLVGYMYSEVSGLPATVYRSYSNGSVFGSGSNIGGLIGYSSGYITVSNGFWDMNTSGQTTSATGTGKTTAEMKAQSTFTSWDFSTIWNMTESTTYPYLRSNTQSPLPQ
ncbi:MAG TPA: GLUG motif-containing protein [archaeon]|nr:GLUG motif-containing protein [archaeon]